MCRRYSLQSLPPRSPTEGKRVTVKLRRTSYEFAQQLVRTGRYIFDERDAWSEHQPSTRAENEFLAAHCLAEYANWHLALTEGANEETKARYAFVYGDFRRVHRTGLIACVYRAAEWRHKEVELAAHDLLQVLDRASG